MIVIMEVSVIKKKEIVEFFEASTWRIWSPSQSKPFLRHPSFHRTLHLLGIINFWIIDSNINICVLAVISDSASGVF